MSYDDGATHSHRGCDIACMAGPWLLCLGLTIALSALIAKLWRVNKLLVNGRTHRRVVV